MATVETTEPNSGPRASEFAAELGILIAAGIGTTFLFLDVIYPRVGLPGSGPVPIRTLVFLALVSWFLRRRQERWSDFGLRWRAAWWKLVLLVVAVIAARILVIQPIGDFLRNALALPPADRSFFGHIQSNPGALALWLAIAWGVGGFAEEMVFRGYLMRRLAVLFGGTGSAWVVALVAQALIFGLGHAYVGLGGAISGTLGGLTFGAVVLLADRSLWPAVLAHGLWDTLGFVVFYLNGPNG